MVSKAELVLEGNAYILNSVRFEIDQSADRFGRPSSRAKGGRIELEMNSVEDDVLIDWMVRPAKALKGSISLYETDNETKFKELKFENAFCIHYLEVFEEAMEENLITKLTISAGKLSVGNIDLDNEWLTQRT